MGSTLSEVLKYKRQKEAESTASLDAIPQALMMFQQGRQQAQDNTLKNILAQATLAKSGLSFDPSTGQLKQDQNLLLNLTKPVYTVDASGNLKNIGTVPGKSTVKQLPLTPEAIGERSKASRQAVTDMPNVNQDTQGAVAAYEYTAPRLQEITDIINSGAFKGDAFTRLAKQIVVGKSGELVVPDGHPLESLVGRINDIRLTGFGLGGKNFTENEAKIVFGRLDPTAKSDKRYLQDLNSLQDFFKLKAQAGTRGLSATKEILNKNSSRTSTSNVQTFNVNGKTYNIPSDQVSKFKKEMGIK